MVAGDGEGWGEVEGGDVGQGVRRKLGWGDVCIFETMFLAGEFCVERGVATEIGGEMVDVERGRERCGGSWGG